MLFLLGLFVACNEERTVQSPAEARNIALVKQVYEHFNNHNWKAMAALYRDSAEFKDPSFGAGVVRQTHNEIIEKYAKYQEASPDIRDEIVQIYASGPSHVIVEFVSSGTAPNGEPWSMPICTIFTIENGVIVKDYTYYNNQ